MEKERITIYCSWIIILFTIFSLTMFFLDKGIIVKVTSDAFNTKVVSEYRAIEIIFENLNLWGIISIVVLILGGLSVLIKALNSSRFLLSLSFFVLSSIFTLLLPSIVGLSTLNLGTVLTIKPSIGYPLFISLLMQIAAIITNGLLFIVNKKA